MSKFISLTGLSEFLTKCRALFYTKPNSGIPTSDLASSVQTSLGKADSAYQKSNSGIPKTDLASGVQSSLDLADSSVQANPVGSVTPAVDPYDYATREELSQLGQKLTGLAIKTVSVFETGKYINDCGVVSASANYNIFSVSVNRGDLIYIKGNISSGIAALSRDFSSTRYDAFILGRGNQVPIWYIAEKTETLYISLAINTAHVITHIENAQVQTFMDEMAQWPSFTDVTYLLKKRRAYVTYNDGSFHTTSSNITVGILPCAGLSQVMAFVTAGDTLPAAIAFYSTPTPTTGGYIKASSVQIGRNNGGGRWYLATVPSNAVSVAFTNHNGYNSAMKVKVERADWLLKKEMLIQPLNIREVFRDGIFYSHLFLDKATESATDIIIPSQSLEDIRIARRLGFRMIEVNAQKTSDGQFVCIHGSVGKFGYEVVDLNGEFTYANTAINSVTLDWIKANLRYRSDIPKYRTAIPSLEEFLHCCRENNMAVFSEASSAELVAILDGILGAGNYIAYNGDHDLTDAPVYQYLSLSTKADILARARSVGAPYIYAMSNPNSFTDEELADIVNSLHQEGFYIGTAYISAGSQQRLVRLGFDLIASQFQVNDFHGNLLDISDDTDFADFALTGATVSAEGTVTLSSGKNITPVNVPQSVFLGKGSLHITYSGSLQVVMGGITQTLTAEEGEVADAWLSTYYMNAAPTFVINGVSVGGIVHGLTFNASKC